MHSSLRGTGVPRLSPSPGQGRAVGALGGSLQGEGSPGQAGDSVAEPPGGVRRALPRSQGAGGEATSTPRRDF